MTGVILGLVLIGVALGKTVEDWTTERLLRPEEVARAWQIGRTKVFALIRSGELRSCRIGGSRRIPESAAAEYLARQLEAS